MRKSQVPPWQPEMLALSVERLGPLPLVNHFLERLALEAHLERFVPTPRRRTRLPFFGGIRHHGRRTTGRKRASLTLVVRGAVRAVATTVNGLSPLTPGQPAPTDLEAWRVQRRRLQNRHQARVLQRRFRRQPDEYLAALEERLIKLSLPP